MCISRHTKSYAKRVLANDFAVAGKQLATIRKLIGLNLFLGLALIVVASSGRYLT